MVTATNTMPSATALFNKIQAGASSVKEWTGKEVAFAKSECGTSVHAVNLETNETIQYFKDLIRAGLFSSNCFQSAVEDMSKRYAQLREELSTRYGDNQDALYRQLGYLNEGFYKALRNAIISFVVLPDKEGMGSIADDAKKHISNKMDCFFERFINSIRQGDFNTAILEAMKEAGLWSEERANPIMEINLEKRITFNIRGGLVVITFCEDGIMDVQIIRGKDYGKTNAELGRYNNYEETEDMENDGVKKADNTDAPKQVAISKTTGGTTNA